MTIKSGYSTPTPDECLRVLAEYGTPEHVIAHCRAVAAVGYTLATALDRKGVALDEDLVLAAGLLHDMARVEDEHWEVAADYCLSRGWSREAEIIRQHMRYEFNSLEDLNETDIVCLSDRLVLEDRYVGLQKRMDYIVAKAIKNGNDNYVPHILRRKEETKKLIAGIEEIIGVSLDKLMEDIDYMDPVNNRSEG